MKEKITNLKAQITEQANKLLDKAPFLKKILSPPPPSAEEIQKIQKKSSLSKIYREGSVLTRLQVISVYFFAIIGIMIAGAVTKKMLNKFAPGDENEKLKKEYAQGFADIKKRIEDNATMVSIGTILLNSYAGENQKAFMSLDLWAKVSDIEAANFVEKNDLLLHDRSIEILNELVQSKVNFLTEEGKAIAREQLKEKLNQSMAKGKIVEIFFHNFIMQ